MCTLWYDVDSLTDSFSRELLVSFGLPSFCRSRCFVLRNFTPVVTAPVTRMSRPAFQVSWRLRRFDASFVRVPMLAPELNEIVGLTG